MLAKLLLKILAIKVLQVQKFLKFIENLPVVKIFSNDLPMS